MRKLQLFTLLLLPGPLFGQNTAVPRPMAKSGDAVWVCAYDVKADKRAQYERFVHEIFWSGAAKLAATDRQVFHQTRVMHPTKANADGSYTYAFIMDPVVEGGDYNSKVLTEKMYGKAKGDDYYKLFAGALKPGNNYHEFLLTQSKD